MSKAVFLAKLLPGGSIFLIMLNAIAVYGTVNARGEARIGAVEIKIHKEGQARIVGVNVIVRHLHIGILSVGNRNVLFDFSVFVSDKGNGDDLILGTSDVGNATRLGTPLHLNVSVTLGGRHGVTGIIACCGTVSSWVKRAIFTCKQTRVLTVDSLNELGKIKLLNASAVNILLVYLLHNLVPNGKRRAGNEILHITGLVIAKPYSSREIRRIRRKVKVLVIVGGTRLCRNVNVLGNGKTACSTVARRVGNLG